MPWVKLDDRFPSHRKVALLSDRAFRLHVSALCWCSENLTDGHITDRELPLVAKVRSVKATAQQLVDAGVWDRTADGWAIHDYLDYNPSREQTAAERKKNAARQEAFRKRRNGKPTPPPSGDSNGGSNGVTKTGETHDGDTNAARRRHDGDTNAPQELHEDEEEAQVSSFRNGVTNGVPSRPVPSPTPSMADVGGGSAGNAAPTPRPDGPSPIDDGGFILSDSMRRWALDTFGPAIDIDHETALFIDHFRAEGTHRANWPAAWQKWIRRSAKWASERATRPPLRAVSGGHQPWTNPTDQNAYYESL